MRSIQACTLMLACVGALAVHQAAGQATRPAPDLETLRTLKPLPRVMYSWPVNALPHHRDPLVYEVARVQRSVNMIVGPDWSAAAWEEAADVCRELGAAFAIHLVPWYHQFKAADPARWGEPVNREMQWTRERFAEISAILKSRGITPAAVLLDCERFKAGLDDDPLLSKYAITYELCKSAWPGVPVDWFEMGTANPRVYIGSGFVEKPWFPAGTPRDSLSCQAYYTPQPLLMKTMLEWTLARADAEKVGRVLFWCSLGGAWTAQRGSLEDGWQNNAGYDETWSWRLGWYSNTTPWNRTTFACYPHPRENLGHFVAFVQGAHRMPMNVATRPTD